MPGPFVVPVHGDVKLPEKVDVVVIGGGIIGFWRGAPASGEQKRGSERR